jgi:hypothetical protein
MIQELAVRDKCLEVPHWAFLVTFYFIFLVKIEKFKKMQRRILNNP